MQLIPISFMQWLMFLLLRPDTTESYSLWCYVCSSKKFFCQDEMTQCDTEHSSKACSRKLLHKPEDQTLTFSTDCSYCPHDTTPTLQMFTKEKVESIKCCRKENCWKDFMFPEYLFRTDYRIDFYSNVKLFFQTSKAKRKSLESATYEAIEGLNSSFRKATFSRVEPFDKKRNKISIRVSIYTVLNQWTQASIKAQLEKSINTSKPRTVRLSRLIDWKYPTSVQLLSTKECQGEMTNSLIDGMITWPTVNALLDEDLKVHVSCGVETNKLFTDEYVIRICHPNGQWSPTYDSSNCFTATHSPELGDMLPDPSTHVTSQNAAKISRSVADFCELKLKENQPYSRQELYRVSILLGKAVERPNFISTEVGNNVMTAIDRLIEQVPEALHELVDLVTSANKFRSIMDRVTKFTHIDKGFYLFKSPNIGVITIRDVSTVLMVRECIGFLTNDDVTLSCSKNDLEQKDSSYLKVHIPQLTSTDAPPFIVMKRNIVSVTVYRIREAMAVTVKNKKRTRRSTDDVSKRSLQERRLNSWIVIVDNMFGNMPGHPGMSLVSFKQINKELTATCVSMNNRSRFGERTWMKSDLCKFVNTYGGRTVCACSRNVTTVALTSLYNIEGGKVDSQTAFSFILQMIQFILNILPLSLTFIGNVIRVLQRKINVSFIIFFNVSAYICMYNVMKLVSFGKDVVNDPTLCMAVGMLLHYSEVSVFAWLLLDAWFVIKMIGKKRRKNICALTCVLCFLGTFIPIIAVCLVISTAQTLMAYGLTDQGMCLMKKFASTAVAYVFEFFVFMCAVFMCVVSFHQYDRACIIMRERPGYSGIDSYPRRPACLLLLFTYTVMIGAVVSFYYYWLWACFYLFFGTSLAVVVFLYSPSFKMLQRMFQCIVIQLEKDDKDSSVNVSDDENIQED